MSGVGQAPSNASEALLGARIRRIDGPWDDLLALTLAGEHVRGVLLLGVGVARGVGLCGERPRGKPASSFVQGLRRRIEGARLVALEDMGAVVRISLARGDAKLALELWLSGKAGNIVLSSADGSAPQMLRPRAPRPDEGETRGAFDCDLQTLEQRGAALLARQQGALVSGTRIAYARAIRSHARRLQRRLRAIEGDLDRAGDVDALRSNASLLLSHLHALDPRAQEATLLDYTLDPPTEVQLKFDVGLGPRRQADLWFHRARRHERGAAMARQRLALTRGELDATVRLLEQVESADDEQVLERLVPELEREGIPVPVATDRKRSATPAARLPYREYTGTGGRAILVGRGPEDNDRLTLDHARPQDLWLHARGYAGAHVIVPLERDEACPPDLLCDAATLAAHYSKAKGQARVDVAYTPRRYVRKPRKAAPGLVTLQREKVFRLELEPARLERLMVSERRRSQAQ